MSIWGMLRPSSSAVVRALWESSPPEKKSISPSPEKKSISPRKVLPSVDVGFTPPLILPDDVALGGMLHEARDPVKLLSGILWPWMAPVLAHSRGHTAIAHGPGERQPATLPG